MIYEPQEDSYLLLKYVKKYSFGEVLDIGTGSGILAEGALNSKKVKSVLAVDINKEAIKLVKSKGINAKISNLFSKVKGRFDAIIFNPPYLPVDINEDQESRISTTGGKKGYEILERFFKNVKIHLNKNGIILVVFSSLTNKRKVIGIIKKNGFKFKLLEKKKISFEELFVYIIK